MKSFKKYFKLRYFVLSTLTLIILGIAIANALKDPWIKKVENLEALAKIIPAGNNANAPALMPDAQGIRILVDEMKNFKYAFLLESVRRANDLSKSSQVSVLGDVAVRYFSLQTKLLNNYMRYAHRPSAAVETSRSFSSDAYQHLNLQMDTSVSDVILSNKKAKKVFNIRRSKDSKGEFTQSELFITEKDKVDMELLTLADFSHYSPGNSKAQAKVQYAKLLQLQTVYENLVNRWSLRRMYDSTRSLEAGLSDSLISTPQERASSLLSFKSKNEYSRVNHMPVYRELWQQDFQMTFQGVEEKLKQAIGQNSILEPNDTKKMIVSYFKSFASYQKSTLQDEVSQKETQAILQKTKDSQDADDIEMNKQFMSLGTEANSIKSYVENESYKDYIKGLEKINLGEKNKIGMQLRMLNLPSDSFKTEDIIERNVPTFFDIIQLSMAYQLLELAAQQGIDEVVTVDAKDKTKVTGVKPEAMKPAIKLVQSLTNSYRASWVKEVSKSFRAILTGSAWEEADAKRREAAKRELFDNGYAYASRGVKGFLIKTQVQNAIDKIVKENKGVYAISSRYIEKSYLEHGMSTGGYNVQSAHPKHEYFKVAAKAVLPFMLAPSNPDQYSQVFYRKLEFYRKNFSGTKYGAFNQAVNNKAVMRAMQDFFAMLAEEFHKKTQGVDYRQYNSRTTPMNALIPVVAKKAFDKYKKSMKEHNDFVFNQNKINLDERTVKRSPYEPLQVPRVDALAVQKPQRPILKGFSEKDQTDALTQYAVLMTLLGLGKEVSGIDIATSDYNSVGVWAAVPFEGYFQLEKSLIAQSPGITYAERAAMSLKDQEFMGDIYTQEALGQYGVLGIHYNGDDEKPILLKGLIKYYKWAESKDASAGWDKAGYRNEMDSVLRGAYVRSSNKVEPLLAADPTKPGSSSFKKVFLASTAFRKQFQAADEKLVKIDESIAEDQKTTWEKIEEWMEPVGIILGAAMLLLLVPALAPGLVGFIGSAVSAVTGISAASLGAGFATVTAALFGKIGILTINAFFWAQVLVSYHVSMVTLPQQYKYQMGFANTQIGIFSKPSVDKEELAQFREEIRAKQKMAAIMMGAQVIVEVGQVIPRAYKFLGFKGKKAMKRLVTKDTQAIAEDLRKRSFKEFVKEYGPTKGSELWLKRFGAEIRDLGKVQTLRATKDAPNKLASLLKGALTKEVKTTTRQLEIYATELKRLEEEGVALLKNIEDMQDYLMRKGANEIAPTEKMKRWFQSRLEVLFSKKARYYSAQIDRQLADQMVGMNFAQMKFAKPSEAKALVMISMKNQLEFDMQYLNRLQTNLMAYEKSHGKTEGLKLFMEGLSDSDLVFQRQIFGNVYGKKSVKGLAQGEVDRLAANRLTGNQKFQLIQDKYSKIFNSYDYLSGDLTKMNAVAIAKGYFYAKGKTHFDVTGTDNQIDLGPSSKVTATNERGEAMIIIIDTKKYGVESAVDVDVEILESKVGSTMSTPKTNGSQTGAIESSSQKSEYIDFDEVPKETPNPVEAPEAAPGAESIDGMLAA